jgi:hypothetical protein
MLLTLLASALMPLEPWLSFRREPSFHEPLVVEVGTLHTKGPTAYWFKLTTDKGDGKTIQWTDTDRCPAARSVLRAVRNLEMPPATVPFLDNDDVVVTADGIIYELQGDAAYGDSSAYGFKISSNTGTPLARWVDESLATLSECWSKDEPRQDA